MRFHYPDEIFSDDSCQILESDRDNSWVVLERAGPLYFLTHDTLRDIARGLPAGNGDGVYKTRLNTIPSDRMDTIGWEDLLERLGIADRYPGTFGSDTEYEFFGFHLPTTIFEYFVGSPLPLPPGAVSFLAEYGRRYVPIDRDA